MRSASGMRGERVRCTSANGGIHRRGDIRARRQRYQVTEASSRFNSAFQRPMRARRPGTRPVPAHSRAAGRESTAGGRRAELRRGPSAARRVRFPVREVAVVEFSYVVGQSAHVAAVIEPFLVLALEVATCSRESLRAVVQGVEDGHAHPLLQLVGKVPLGRTGGSKGSKSGRGSSIRSADTLADCAMAEAGSTRRQTNKPCAGLHRLSLLVCSMRLSVLRGSRRLRASPARRPAEPPPHRVAWRTVRIPRRSRDRSRGPADHSESNTPGQTP